MPIRFPTEAANDPDVGGEGTPRGRADGTPQRDRRGEPGQDDARPGKDINQAGFIRERDRGPEAER
ncbi:MAG TPA: hypothetical protein VIE63_00035 [Ramlibacter sp.]